MQNMNMFELMYPKYRIKNKVRLIELFAGIGSQAKALERIGADFEHYRVVEFDKYAIASYNAVHGTNFETSDITKITAKDLNIVDRDKFTYLLTYSFPCQSLSIAGKMEGMAKGSGTRSGLLWEVERLLDECNGELPQILLMENVKEVIGTKNIKDFQAWQYKLEELGYSNYVKILNSKNHGIPQNRQRCFMVSILGQYYYEFPKKKKLEIKLKDMLEDNVNEKYYLSEKFISYLNSISGNGRGGYNRKAIFELNQRNQEEKGISPTITTREGTRATDTFIIDDSSIAVPEKTSKGYALAAGGDGIYTNRPHQKRGTVQKGMIPTIKTSPNDIGVVIDEE